MNVGETDSPPLLGGLLVKENGVVVDNDSVSSDVSSSSSNNDNNKEERIINNGVLSEANGDHHLTKNSDDILKVENGKDHILKTIDIEATKQKLKTKISLRLDHDLLVQKNILRDKSVSPRIQRLREDLKWKNTQDQLEQRFRQRSSSIDLQGQGIIKEIGGFHSTQLKLEGLLKGRAPVASLIDKHILLDKDVADSSSSHLSVIIPRIPLSPSTSNSPSPFSTPNRSNGKKQSRTMVDNIVLDSLMRDPRDSLTSSFVQEMSLKNGRLVNKLEGEAGGVSCIIHIADKVWIGYRAGVLVARVDETFESIPSLKREIPSFYTMINVGRSLWCGYSNGNIQVFDASDGKVTMDMKSAHTGGVTCLVYVPKFEQVWSGGDDGTLSIWTASGGDLIQTLSGHNSPVKCLCVSTTVDSLSTGGITSAIVWSAHDGENGVRIWDPLTKESNALFYFESNVTCMIPVWNSVWVATGEWDIKVADSQTGAIHRTLEGHTAPILTLLQVGVHVWSASNDRTIRVWDIKTSECIKIIHGHTSPINSLALVGERVWSSSSDSSIRIWSCSGVVEQLWMVVREGRDTAIDLERHCRKLDERLSHSEAERRRALQESEAYRKKLDKNVAELTKLRNESELLAAEVNSGERWRSKAHMQHVVFKSTLASIQDEVRRLEDQQERKDIELQRLRNDLKYQTQIAERLKVERLKFEEELPRKDEEINKMRSIIDSELRNARNEIDVWKGRHDRAVSELAEAKLELWELIEQGKISQELINKLQSEANTPSSTPLDSQIIQPHELLPDTNNISPLSLKQPVESEIEETITPVINSLKETIPQHSVIVMNHNNNNNNNNNNNHNNNNNNSKQAPIIQNDDDSITQQNETLTTHNTEINSFQFPSTISISNNITNINTNIHFPTPNNLPPSFAMKRSKSIQQFQRRGSLPNIQPPIIPLKKIAPAKEIVNTLEILKMLSDLDKKSQKASVLQMKMKALGDQILLLSRKPPPSYHDSNKVTTPRHDNLAISMKNYWKSLFLFIFMVCIIILLLLSRPPLNELTNEHFYYS